VGAGKGCKVQTGGMTVCLTEPSHRIPGGGVKGGGARWVGGWVGDPKARTTQPWWGGGDGVGTVPGEIRLFLSFVDCGPGCLE